jgi:hypothetical protein
MLHPINFTLHKLPTSEILAFLKCWFFPASFASMKTSHNGENMA